MKFWDWVEQTLTGLLGLCALIVALWQVIGRYLTPEHAISYAEEVIVYLVIWAIMIISSQLARRDGHVRPDLVLRLLSPQVARWMEVFNCLVAIVFSLAMLWYGVQIVQGALAIDERSSSDLQFPMWIYYLSLPTGGALMAVRYVIRLFRYLFHYDPRTMKPGHVVHETVEGLEAPKSQ